MKTPAPALTLALMLALAGCADPPGIGGPDGATDEDGDVGHADGASRQIGGNGTTAESSTPITLILDAPEASLRNASWALEGSVDATVLLSVLLIHGTERIEVFTDEVDGPFFMSLDLPFGQSIVEATADDGTTTATATVDLVREAAGEIEVRFTASLDKEDRDDPIWVDIDELASAPLYPEGCENKHPDHATVHDAMVVWSRQTGIKYDAGDCASGFFMKSIDGHENPNFWCYQVNGETAELGMALQPWSPDDRVTWLGCDLVFG